jgi:hypothetical protein
MGLPKSILVCCWVVVALSIEVDNSRVVDRIAVAEGGDCGPSHATVQSTAASSHLSPDLGRATALGFPDSLITVRCPYFRLEVGVVVVRHVVVTVLERTGLKALSRSIAPVILVLVHAGSELACSCATRCERARTKWTEWAGTHGGVIDGVGPGWRAMNGNRTGA